MRMMLGHAYYEVGIKYNQATLFLIILGYQQILKNGFRASFPLLFSPLLSPSSTKAQCLKSGLENVTYKTLN